MRTRTFLFLMIASIFVTLGCKGNFFNKLNGNKNQGNMKANQQKTYGQYNDYMPTHLYLAKKPGGSDRYYPSLMKQRPAGQNRKAVFIDVTRDQRFETSVFYRSRPATRSDLQVGKEVFAMYDTFRTPNKAADRWKNMVYHWEKTTIVDNSDAGSGVIDASMGGELRSIHYSNLRIPQ